MLINKALITAAGRSQRHLPLQTIIGRDGFPRSVLSHLISEALSAGIERIGVVISPGDEELYRRAAGSDAQRIEFIEQPDALGYGDAIYRGRDFTGSDAFLLMVSDHIYISSDADRSCASQLVETARNVRCPVSAVQSTHESMLSSFGALGGTPYDGTRGLYEIERVLEKPTPTRAEQDLLVPGLRHGYYLCFFGMHVVTSPLMDTLGEMLAAASDPRTVNLSTALDCFCNNERALALELEGRRFDLQQPYGLLIAQLALALDGPRRADVLAALVNLLADAS